MSVSVLSYTVIILHWWHDTAIGENKRLSAAFKCHWRLSKSLRSRQTQHTALLDEQPWISRWTTNWRANTHEPSAMLMTSFCWPLWRQNYRSWLI